MQSAIHDWDRAREIKGLIRVIDIETTGIDPATSEIIEIASVDLVRGVFGRTSMATATKSPLRPRSGQPLPRVRTRRDLAAPRRLRCRRHGRGVRRADQVRPLERTHAVVH